MTTHFEVAMHRCGRGWMAKPRAMMYRRGMDESFGVGSQWKVAARMMQFLQGNLPFGGVNNSGIGRAHGHYGFKEFSHERGVVKTQFAFAAMLMMPGQVLPIMRKALKAGFKSL